MVTISVITCTYNASATLQRTLDSVLEQLWDRVEHIIIDGQSTDNTVAIAEDYKRISTEKGRKHAITIISEPDKGLYDAMNKGLKMATGSYIVYLNAGDTFHSPNTLKLVAQVASSNDKRPGVIYGETDLYDMAGNFVRHRRLKVPDRLTTDSFMMGMLICHQAFYARTDIAKETPYDTRYRFSADYDWCINIIRKSEQRHFVMRRLRTVVAHYLDEGLTTQNQKASLKERFRVMKKQYGLLNALISHFLIVIRAIVQR